MMRSPLPFIWTRGLRRGWNRLAELATGDPAAVIIYGESGAGKTELCEKFCREWAWRGPVDYYVRKIRHGNWFPDINLDSAIDLAEQIGLVDDQNVNQAEALLADRFRMDDTRKICITTIWHWRRWLADRLGRPVPTALDGLKLWMDEEVRGRYPVLIQGKVEDRPRDLDLKMLTQLEPPDDPGGRVTDRWFRLNHILEDVPVLLIVDEADMLKAETLHNVRQLCDSTHTPLVLAGTRLLESRLQRDPRLRPLATRVATQVELGPVTLKDLQAALPDHPAQVVLAIWQAGRGQFRTITLLLKELQKFQEANPGRRLSRKAVALAAEHLVAAVPIPPAAEEEPDAMPETATVVATPRRAAQAVATAQAARVAARAG